VSGQKQFIPKQLITPREALVAFAIVGAIGLVLSYANSIVAMSTAVATVLTPGFYNALFGYLVNYYPTGFLAYVQWFFGWFYSFPSVLAWFVGGLMLGIFLKHKAATMVKNNSSTDLPFAIAKGEASQTGLIWSLFRLSLLLVAIVFIGFGVAFIGFSLGGQAMAGLATAFGGFLLFELTLFAAPAFWMQLIFLTLGGMVGGAILKGPVKPLEVIVPEKAGKTVPSVSKKQKMMASYRLSTPVLQSSPAVTPATKPITTKGGQPQPIGTKPKQVIPQKIKAVQSETKSVQVKTSAPGATTQAHTGDPAMDQLFNAIHIVEDKLMGNKLVADTVFFKLLKELAQVEVASSSNGATQKSKYVADMTNKVKDLRIRAAILRNKEGLKPEEPNAQNNLSKIPALEVVGPEMPEAEDTGTETYEKEAIVSEKQEFETQESREQQIEDQKVREEKLKEQKPLVQKTKEQKPKEEKMKEQKPKPKKIKAPKGKSAKPKGFWGAIPK